MEVTVTLSDALAERPNKRAEIQGQTVKKMQKSIFFALREPARRPLLS
jgi:hypothetical protein